MSGLAIPPSLFIFGIAIALILGWYHGEKGQQRVAPFEILQLGVVGLLALATSLYVVMIDFQERARENLLGLVRHLKAALHLGSPGCHA